MVKGIVAGQLYTTKTKYPETYEVVSIHSSRIENGGVLVKFIPSGYLKFYDARQLRRGSIASPYQTAVFGVGYIGEGSFETSDASGKPTDEYRRWKAMLSRCYNTKRAARDESYSNCSVCEEWLCFQTFAEWIASDPNYAAGYELDKDLLVKGNRIYGPKTCCLLPKCVNAAITGKDVNGTNGLPCGVTWHKKNNCYVASVGKYGEKKYLGSFSCPEVAWSVVKEEKEIYIKEYAMLYKDKLKTNVYDALLRFVAEPFNLRKES